MEEVNFERETSCFLVPSHGILSVTTDNSAGSVDFDFFNIWEQFKKLTCKNVCMIHTHPNGFNRMSGIDRNMVYGWVQGLGVPIMFVIITDTAITCYLCKRNKDNKNKVDRTVIDFYANESFEQLCNVIYHISTMTKEIAEGTMEEVVKTLNEMFSDADIKEQEKVTA